MKTSWSQMEKENYLSQKPKNVLSAKKFKITPQAQESDFSTD